MLSLDCRYFTIELNQMLPRGLLKEYSSLLSFLMRLIDNLILISSGMVAYFLRFTSWHMPSLYFAVIMIAVGACNVIFSCLHIYSSKRLESFWRHSLSLLHAMLLLMCTLGTFSFLTKFSMTLSRIWFGTWMFIAFGLLLFFRLSMLIILRFMRKKGLNERKVIIIGVNDYSIMFANNVQQAMWTGFRIVGFIADQMTTISTQALPIYPLPLNFKEFLQQHDIDEIWLAMPLNAESKADKIMHKIRHLTVTTRYLLNIYGFDVLNHSVTDIAGFPILNLRTSPMIGMNRVLKACEDRLLGTLILMLCSPLLITIALLVKLTSSGPVLFKQKRLGWDGRIITIYKFRTMYVYNEIADVLTQATINDPRVTPFGRYLRRFSLDELPQFINVIQGRMSIVGPRPHALIHNEQYKEVVTAYMQRHQVKPGITGWAQINGWRGETDTVEKMQKRVEFDLYYINHWSLLFDLKIIFLTFFKGFLDKNAY